MTNNSSQDEKFILETLKLAESMRGRTSPDPMVGSVIVKDGKIISRGYHAEVTTPHAEAWAIEKVGNEAQGATLYVNLEPCCFFEAKANPPCTQAIINAKIKRVVTAMEDPNPMVAGKGIQELQDAGIEVDVGILEEEAKKLNEVFIKYVTTGRPFVILKSAMSLDGKIATRSGESFWITGLESRKKSHYLRSIVDAVLVGLGTVLKDDPELTCRFVKGKDPLKVILDPNLEVPLNSKILSINPKNTIFCVSKDLAADKIQKVKEKGADIIQLKSNNNHFDFDELILELGKRKITSLLIEGGGRVNASAIQAGVVDKVIFFISPKIIGGKDAPTPIDGEGIKSLSQAIKLKDITTERLEEDIVVEGYVIR
jgi:diaminohydroxyphosphoribosylaminopyrimidine deaminase/5-amino-6-(5-phosphoribosylamino)uracil reductase